ncbi:MAG: EAL domain-containing protein [Marinobacter sp.]|nr:EAL domain-containing protein [Marinobacter sp.]
MNQLIELKSRMSAMRSYREPDPTSWLQRVTINSVFQPIFSPAHNRLVGYEALIRPLYQGQPLSPPELFHKADRQGLAEALDVRVHDAHVRNFAGHSYSEWLFVNITPATCIHPDLSLDGMVASCEALHIPTSQIVLEIVESSTPDKVALLDFIREAKARGFQIAIDDFGVGDSNFERIWQLEPLVLKVDRSLLLNAEQNRRARHLLESLVRVIRESGSLVLIEGVETDQQASIALSTEADLVQGFRFGRPGTLPNPFKGQQEQALTGLMATLRAGNDEDMRQHLMFLKSLRFELLQVTHQLAQQQPLDQACEALLELDGVKRCFLLNGEGTQQSSLISNQPQERTTMFNPLYLSSGACWNHREYFRNAVDQPGRITVSRPYVALPDAKRTVTVSYCFTLAGKAVIFCVDIHPDEVFGGNLEFPRSL